MRILQMYPKDITLLCEFTVSDLMKIRGAMDMVQVNYNAGKPEETELKDFLTINFMQFLDTAIKGATDGA
jgi:hypothetical protein